MKPIDLNKLAKRVSKFEGGKKPMTIAQIKEAQKCVLWVLSEYSGAQVLEAVERVGESYEVAESVVRGSVLKKRKTK